MCTDGGVMGCLGGRGGLEVAASSSESQADFIKKFLEMLRQLCNSSSEM